jgi:CspA family cold shock protein
MPPTSGTIKRITDKGFGFIAAADGTEYFFHRSACTSTPFDSMREGDNVYDRPGSERSPRRERPTGVVASIPVSLMAPFAAPSQETAARAMVRSRTAEARCCRTNP